MIDVLVFIAAWMRENLGDWAERDCDFVMIDYEEPEGWSRWSITRRTGFGLANRTKWLDGPTRTKITVAVPSSGDGQDPAVR